MKVYLAAWFSSKNETLAKAEELRACGIEVTSRWLDEKVAPATLMSDVTEDYLTQTAQIDIQDIDAADALVLLTVDPENGPCHRRGGRHFESGYAAGRGKTLIICGPKENVFHYTPGVQQFDTWQETKEFLLGCYVLEYASKKS